MRLDAQNISKSYNKKEIIKNVSIYAEGSEIVSLLGVSGVGKTTLFNIISGIKPPDKGRVLLNGRDITSVPGHVGYMLQKDMLLEHLNIIDNVSIPLVIKGEKKKVARQKALKFFEKFGLLGYENKYPKELSGGMRQRAALLRTYLFSSNIVLLDEPFSALDAITKRLMQEWYLSVIKEIKLPTIFITHDIEEAILLSDRIYIMSGSPGEISAEFNINRPCGVLFDFDLCEKFIEYKKEIIEKLNS